MDSSLQGGDLCQQEPDYDVITHLAESGTLHLEKRD